jgi:imidazole glycerol-phosphate synthase subunit HisH
VADNKNQIAIIDYEMGNLFSVKRACEQVDLYPLVTADAAVIMKSDAIILPGVGAFGDAMSNLKKLDLTTPIKEFIKSGRLFIGVCLGMQLLMSESEEFGCHKGLDIIKGTVVKFPIVGNEQRAIKVPQVGWNRIYRPLHADDEFWQNSLFRGIPNDEYMYFVHSFYTEPEDPKVTLSFTNYEGVEYSSSIFLDNIFACQFHPEKSATAGMKIYANIASLIKQWKGSHE